jgi:hypothetical protein
MPTITIDRTRGNLKINLLRELANIDQIIEELESRRVDIINMLDVIESLSALAPFETSRSDSDLAREKVVPISIQPR